MPDELPTWERPYYCKPGGRPFLFFVVYGAFKELPPLSRSRYRSAGPPAGVSLQRYDATESPEVSNRFREGYLWDELTATDPALARQVAESPGCIILRGELDDQRDLNYLRDSVGLLTYLLDNGGVTLYDPFAFQWWAPDAWRDRIFNPAAAVPRHHVVVLTSDEPNDERQGDGEARAGCTPTTWYHTRGMRRFGRPDISVRGVSSPYHDAAVDLCERFIEYQAFGGVIDEGQEVKVRGLPPGMRCNHAGTLDDPDFNNVRVEVTMPS
jgi:hypothetical protein